METTEAIEWRRRTVSCAIRLNYNGTERIERVAAHIWTFISPVRISTGPKGHSDAGINEIRKSLFELCQKSFKLKLSFRGTRTKYVFELLSPDTAYNNYDSEVFEEQGAEGTVSNPLDPEKTKVFCTLFGALVKTRDTASAENSRRVVLCPGHIIIRERPTRH